MKDENQKVRCRITDYPNGWGVKTEVDGQELPEVRDVHFKADVDSVAELKVNMFVTRPMEIDVSAKVTVNLMAMPGADILDITTHSEAGDRRHFVVSYPRK